MIYAPHTAVGNDNRLFLRLFKLLERLQFQCHVFGHACRFYVVGSDFVGFRIIVVSVYLMSEFTFLAVVIINLVKQFLVEINPLFEGKFLAEYARRDISGYQAASMGIVPEPHMGSIRSHSPRQPLINIMPAARTSFNGASTASWR